MLRYLLIAFAAALFPFSAFAACSNQPLAQDQAFRISAVPLSSHQVEVRLRIEPCYILYQNRLSFHLTNAKLLDFPKPVGVLKKDPWFGHVGVFRKSFSVILPFEAKAPGSHVTLRVKYQGCAESLGICYPLSQQTLTFIVPRGALPGQEVFAGHSRPMFDTYQNPVFGTQYK